MKLLHNFLTSGHVFSDDEYTLKSKISFLNIVILLTGFIVLSLTILQHDKHILVLINSLFIIISLVSIYMMRKKKGFYALASYIFILYAFSTITFLLIKYPDVYIRSSWLLVLITFSFFSVGEKGGFIIYFLSMIELISLYSFSVIHVDAYSFYVIISFITLNTLIISQYEKREMVAKRRLYEVNNGLEEKVRQETKKLIEQKDAYRQLAYFDSLTSLPNRSFFQEQLKYALAQSQRNGTKTGVLFIDLDNFKEINDVLGHQMGDKVLKKIAIKLKNVLRKSDILSRLGGDEFTVIINDLKTNSDAGVIAQNLRKAISTPLLVNEHEFFMTASVGISIYPDDSLSAEDLIKCADTAMYSAKQAGSGLTHYYQPRMTDALLERTLLETYIRRGIENDEFVVYYQPIVNAQKHVCVGLEALVRWHHPQKGLLFPDAFIPVAEKSSLIVPLGERVLQQVVGDLIGWHAIGIDPKFISVNLSPKQLSHPGLLSMISQIVEKVDFRSNWLEFEITESYTFQNYDRAVALLEQIHDMGIKLSIDDFGIGYSSLSYLKKLPVHKLKIDRSFVMDVPGKKDDVALVRTIVAMGKSLGLQVVAEGVETKEQEAFLDDLGCDLMQGYLYAKPMPKEATEEYMKTLQKRRENGFPVSENSTG